MAAQMSTSVQNITEVVIVMLSALTPWAAISVSVNEDSPEMEKRVRVSKHKRFYSFHVKLILFFFCKLIIHAYTRVIVSGLICFLVDEIVSKL